jgi:hypothetical protein
MAKAKLTPRFTPNAQAEEIAPEYYRLTVPSGKADAYRLAQLDDYNHLPRRHFPHHSLTLSLSARTSSDSIPGTWGFGLWNDPFGLSLGFGGRPWRFPALPNAVWFFGASEENYLSFRAPRPERSEERSLRRTQTKGASSTGFATNAQPSAPPSGTSQHGIANGFLAQTFRAPRFHPLLMLAGLVLPFSRKVTRRLLGQVIAEDGIQLWSQGASLWRRSDTRSRDFQQQAVGVQSQRVDPTQWHRYRLEWSKKRVLFEVDNVTAFESAVSPNPPLGLVIWIDNQYASFTPEGKIGFGVLENPEPAWLEVKDIELAVD